MTPNQPTSHQPPAKTQECKSLDNQLDERSTIGCLALLLLLVDDTRENRERWDMIEGNVRRVRGKAKGRPGGDGL